MQKDLRREIRRSFTRFLSILVMVGLGVMFLVGLRSAAPDMRSTADSFFDRQRMFDLELVSTLGLEEADLACFARQPEVAECEGGWFLDGYLDSGDKQIVIKLLSLGSGLNRPVLLEGSLPAAADECALDQRMAEDLGLMPGDRISLRAGGDPAPTLGSCTVTAIVNSPLYLSLDRGTSSLGDGSVAGFVLLPDEAFDLDYCTVAYLTLRGAAEADAYSEQYAALRDSGADRMEPVLTERAQERYLRLRSDGQQELDDARAELDKAWSDAQRELREAESKLETAAVSLVEGRRALGRARADYETALEDGRAELEAAEAKLDSSRRQLRQAKLDLDQGEADYAAAKEESARRLEDGRQELAEKEAELNEYAAVLEQGKAQTAALRQQTEDYAAALEAQNAEVEALIAAGIPVDYSALPFNEQTLLALQAALAQAEGELAAGEQALSDGRQQLEAGKAALAAAGQAAEEELRNARAKLDAGWKDYDKGRYTLWRGEQDYEKGKQTYEESAASGAERLEDAEQELRDGCTDYNEGIRELMDGRQEAEDAKREAEEELSDGRQKLEELKEPDTYVLTRQSNYGFVSYDQNAQRMANLAGMFPIIFYLVAALVCLTTMTRMVEEERTQVGVIKALGFGTGSIAAKFLIYGAAAAILGGILGAALGTVLIPWIIFFSYELLYTLPELELHIYWPMCLSAIGVGLLCTVLATLWAAFATARQTPAALMRPKAPRPGKRILLERIGPVWRRMSFSMKVSARNLFRYKKRLFMTVIGVAGCTGLLISGLGLHSSIFDILDVQFFDLYRYDVQLTIDPDSEGAEQRVSDFLNASDSVSSWTGVSSRSVTFSHDGFTEDGFLTVTADPEAYAEQVRLRDMDDKSPLQVPENGVLIDLKLSELMGLQEGDRFSVDAEKRFETVVTSLREHYVYHYAVMTARTYRSLTGEDARNNEFLITAADSSDETLSRLCAALMEIDGVLSANNKNAMAKNFRENMQVVDSAVMIIVTSAAALAFVVLYNLTNINITERIRELATIKVLGFYNVEVGMYIYRENIVLTLAGIALGQLFGKYLCSFLIQTIEMDIVMFGRDAKTENYFLSIVLSLAFALIVNIFMYFRIRKIDMVQSLKSVE